jgi:AcrR family transcriptional regulator
MRENGPSTTSRDRILEAAGEVFAQHGFRSATIREICGRAGVNVAAVNYHFGGKKGLYIAALKHWQAVAFKKYPSDPGTKSLPAEKRLKDYIRSFIFRMLGEGRPSWYGKLWAHEFIEPTGALNIMIEDTIQPSFNLLKSIIREILGPGGSEENVSLCAASIIGQCLYFRNASPVVTILFQKNHFSRKEIGEIADHIGHFSLTALKSYQENHPAGASM